MTRCEKTYVFGFSAIVVVIAFFSALVTPAADVLSMFIVALSMAALFGAAVVITTLHDRRAARRMPTPDGDDPSPLHTPGAKQCPA